MVQAMIEIPNETNHILNIVKARFNLKTKSEAIAKMASEYGKTLLEPELRPEFVKKLKRINSEEGIRMSVAELRSLIESGNVHNYLSSRNRKNS